jgi:hypothetical protein
MARAEADQATYFAFGGVLSDICGDLGKDHGGVGMHCTLCTANAPFLPAGPDWWRASDVPSEHLARPEPQATRAVPPLQVLPPARAPPAFSSC